MSCAEKAEAVTVILIPHRRGWDVVVLNCGCGLPHRFAYVGPDKSAEQLPVDAISPCCGTPRGAYAIDQVIILPAKMQVTLGRCIRFGFPMPWPRFGATGAWRAVGRASPFGA